VDRNRPLFVRDLTALKLEPQYHSCVSPIEKAPVPVSFAYLTPMKRPPSSAVSITGLILISCVTAALPVLFARSPKSVHRTVCGAGQFLNQRACIELSAVQASFSMLAPRRFLFVELLELFRRS
jgi:hypothetical protein